MERGLESPSLAIATNLILDLFVAHHLELQWHGHDAPYFRTVPKRIFPVPRFHKVQAEQHSTGVTPTKRLAVGGQHNGVYCEQQTSSLFKHELTKHGADQPIHCCV